MSLQRRHLIALPLLAALPARAGGGEPLQALIDDPRLPLASLSVLARRDGRTVFEAHLGRRHIGPDRPATADTLYRMASVSKLFVALAALRLVDAGRLDLDADVGTLLGYPLRHPEHPAQPITPRLLLSHRSGLRDAGESYADTSRTLRAGVEQGLAWSPAAPGRWFQYCNFNFVVLAGVLERATSLRFDRLMQQQVLDPLGLQGSFDVAQLPEAQRANLATLYRRQPDGRWAAQVDEEENTPAKPPLDEPYEPGSRPSLFAPQGGLRTRVRDLGTVAAMLAAGGLHHGERFLSRNAVATMCSEQWRHDAKLRNGEDAGGLFQAWGVGAQHFIDRSRAGWGDRLRPGGGLQAWGHLGEAYGLLSGLMFEPRQRLSIAYAIGGTSGDPDALHGRYSSFSVWEEQLLAALWGRLR